MDRLDAAKDLVRRSPFACLSTLDDRSGCPETRLVFNLWKWRREAVLEGPARLAHPFESWLGTNTSSRKVAQVRADPRVCLYYADPESWEGLALQGTVTEVLDRAVRAAIWSPDWERYYAGGLDGGDFTLLRFAPSQGRYYHGLEVTEFDPAQVPE